MSNFGFHFNLRRYDEDEYFDHTQYYPALPDDFSHTHTHAPGRILLQSFVGSQNVYTLSSDVGGGIKTRPTVDGKS